jgi:hypothetical protein
MPEQKRTAVYTLARREFVRGVSSFTMEELLKWYTEHVSEEDAQMLLDAKEWDEKVAASAVIWIKIVG